MMTWFPRLALASACCLPCWAGAADFAPVFTGNAVLQRDEPVAVWGTGREGEPITVSILDQSVSTTVKDGKWRVTLPAMPATNSTVMRLVGDNAVELSNVAVGEVWLLTGQSNMEWRLNQCPPYSDALLAGADNPMIRHIKIPHRTYAGDPPSPMDWKIFDRASAPFFSAVGYHFAEALQLRLGVVVGLVTCTFGGTTIEAWMTREELLAAGGSRLLEEHEKKASAFPDAAGYEAAWQAFESARKEWQARKNSGIPEKELGPQPVEPYGYRSKSRPNGLRDSMFGVIRPYTARGIIWYQGESNAGRPLDYAILLKELMTGMRRDWAKDTMPFLIAQISSPTAAFPDEQDAYARIRDAQTRVALQDPHSGFVVTLDYGEKGNVHPVQKQPIGERLARLAMSRVYGDTGTTAQSPTARRASLGNGMVVVEFNDLPGQLEIRDATLPSLEIQSADGRWQPASGTLSPDGRQLFVTAPEGQSPSAVRYAWRNFCPLSLYTNEGLPVSPWSLSIDPQL